MTTPRPPRKFDEPPPAVLVDSPLRTGAGTPVTARIMVTNRAPVPRIMAVTALGVDASWLPHPSRSRPVLPGESIAADLTLNPATGTVPAQYPLAVAVQALDPVTGQATSATTIVELVLVVDAPGQISVQLEPAATTAVFGKRLGVLLHNSGAMPATVRLEVRSPHSTRIALESDVVDVAPGQTRRVAGRLRVVRPQLFGGRSRHTYSVTARSSGAPRYAEGSLTARAMFGPVGTKLAVLVTVIAVWAALAVVFIPKLATTIRGGQDKSVTAATTAAKSAAPDPGASGGAGGSGGSGAGGDGGAGGASTATKVQLNGTVVGNSPAGVTVAIAPTSLVDEAAQGAAPLGFSMAELLGDVGKVPAAAVPLTAPRSTSANRTTLTATDGAWSFPNVKAPGYYLLTFAKAGYQTQRYVVDSSTAVATQPLKVTLVPGQGRLSGTIRGPSGALGGAQITITDGTNTITTSSNSKGAVGTWSVDGLSTPSAYLVSASSDGLSTESQLVHLDAGGISSVSLTLRAGVASLLGRVTGVPNGRIAGTATSSTPVGLGGVQVTATDGTVSRTATTVTGPSTSALVGNYVLPDLTPGRYSVTFAAPGYLAQTQRIVIKPGQSKAGASAVLTSATGVISGTVRGVKMMLDGSGDPELDSAGRPVIAAVNGAGMILTNADNTYKSTSGTDGGFLFNGVAPGTYVLSAQYSGLKTGYVTVTATAGGSATANFELGVESTTNSSTITGFVGGATSPSNTILCTPTPVPPAQCLVTFTLRDSAGVEIDIHDPSPAAPADPGIPPDPKAYVLPAAASGPTAYTLSAVGGLPPALYRLTIKASGFLPTTVSVQVPLNGVGRAPQVNLFPANTISGTVSALGDMATDGAPAGTPYANCVYAIPQGTGVTVPVTCDPGSAGTACASRGTPDVGYSAIDGATGTYLLDGLCDATYLIYVVVTNPLYVNPTPTATSAPVARQTVANGQTVSFSPHVYRLGRLKLGLTGAVSATGAVQPLGSGVAVTAKCTAPSVPDVTRNLVTDADSTIIVSGLATATWSCTVRGDTAATSDQIGSVTGLSAALDTDTPGQVTLATTIGTFYGRVTTSWDGTTKPLQGVTVTVTGVTGYRNGAPQSTSASVVTDAAGCFAFSPDGTPAATSAAPGACASDPSQIPTAAFPLIVSSASFHAVPPPGYQAKSLSVPQISGAALTGIGISPNPVAITGMLTTDPTQIAGPPLDPDLSNASIQVLQAPPGTGSVTVSSDSTGGLTWHDTNITDLANPAQPGTYKLSASLTGYVTAEITFTCDLGVPCDINSAHAFLLRKLGTLTISTVDASGTAIPDASFTLSSGTTQVGAQTPVPGANTVTFTGLVPDGSYRVHIQAAGYQFGDTGTSAVTLDCAGSTAIAITPGAITICTATLNRDAAIKGQVTGILALPPASTPTRPIVGATVTARRCTAPSAAADYCTQTSATDSFTTTTDSDGNYVLIGSSAHRLDAGNWLVTASAAGYTNSGVPAGAPAGALAGTIVVVTDGADTTYNPALYITPVTFSVTLQDQNDKVISDLGSNSAVKLIGPSSTINAVSSGNGTSTVWTFSNVIPGSYTLQVSGDKVVTATNQVTVLLGVASQTYTMMVPLGANLASGTISGLQGPNPPPAPLEGAVACLFSTVPTPSSTCGTVAGPNSNVAPGIDDNPLITTTDANGNFSMGTVPDGKYYLQVQKVGYQTYAQTTAVTYRHTQAAPPAVVQTLARITHNVVVTVATTQADDPIAASTLTLTSQDFPGWILSVPGYAAPPTGSTTHTWTFSTVPFGNWTIKTALPGNHFGVVTSSATNGGPAMTCAATTPATTPATQTCTSATLTVPGTGSTDVPAGYVLTEYQPTIVVTTAPLALDTAPPTSVRLTVGSVYTDTAFTVPAAAAGLPVWVNGPQTITADAGPSYPGWAPKSVGVTDATAKTIALAEVGGSVTVTVSGATDYTLPDATPVSVTLTAPSGAGAPPVANVRADSSGVATATFSNLPYGSGWTASGTSSVSVGSPPTPTPIQGTSTAFTIGSAAAAATISLAR